MSTKCPICLQEFDDGIEECPSCGFKFSGNTEKFKPIKAENSMQLIQLYPELKSNKLVQDQMKLHIKNNNKIKAYKLKKQDYEAAKWWLYFGGKSKQS